MTSVISGFELARVPALRAYVSIDRRETGTLRCRLFLAGPPGLGQSLRRSVQHVQVRRLHHQLLRPLLLEPVDDGGGEDDEAEHDLLRVAAEAEEVHAVLHDG